MTVRGADKGIPERGTVLLWVVGCRDAFTLHFQIGIIDIVYQFATSQCLLAVIYEAVKGPYALIVLQISTKKWKFRQNS